jgi:hypothetical protein
MAKAGFWAVGGYKISFRADGRWYADEEAIAHPRIALLFSQHIRPAPGGGWMIDVGVDRQTIEVEDTPLVVVAVSGDPESGFAVKTNDGVEDALDCETLVIGQGDVLYCEVDRGERGRMRARFLRPAYYELVGWMEEESSLPILRCRGVRHAIGAL